MQGLSGNAAQAAPRQTVFASLISEIQGLVNQIDDRHQNIEMSLGRLLNPRPTAPTAATGISKVAERPAAFESELESVISRLRITVQAAEDLANRLQSAI